MGATIIHTGATAEAKPEVAAAVFQFDTAGNQWAADAILPAYPVDAQEGTIPIICREDLALKTDTRRVAGATYNRGVMRKKDSTYLCVGYGEEEQLPDEERKRYASSFDAEVAKARLAEFRIRLDREIRVKNLVFNTTTWAGGALYTDYSGAPWDNPASNVIAQLNAACEKVRENTGMRANALICGRKAVNNLLANTGILARFPAAPAVTRQLLLNNLLNIFEDLQVLIEGKAVYNSALEGAAFAGSDVWNDDYAMVAVVARDAADLSAFCLGRTLIWRQMGTENVAIGTYRENQTKSDIIQADFYSDEKVIDAYAGHLMKIDA